MILYVEFAAAWVGVYVEGWRGVENVRIEIDGKIVKSRRLKYFKTLADAVRWFNYVVEPIAIEGLVNGVWEAREPILQF